MQATRGTSGLSGIYDYSQNGYAGIEVGTQLASAMSIPLLQGAESAGTPPHVYAPSSPETSNQVGRTNDGSVPNINSGKKVAGPKGSDWE